MADERDKRNLNDGTPSDAAGPPATDAAAARGAAAKGVAAEKGAAAEPPRDAGRPHLTEIDIPRAWLAGMLVALATLLVLATIGFAVINDNRTCGWCHVIRPEVDSFNRSEHHKEGVSCQDCHTKPGVFNYFIHNLAGLTHIIEYISGNYDKPITTFVGTENCVRCHPKEQIERDIVVDNIRVNHTGLREGGYQCVTCHAAVAHGDAIPIGARPKGSIMSVCWQCHNGVEQSQRCSICHLNGVPPGTAQVKMPLHMSSGNCAECHSKRFCAKCHNGLVMPHPNAWPETHGQTVVARGASICAGCHTRKDPNFCISCHGVVMPHPADWPSQHGAVASRDAQVCVKCHGKDSCLRCHGLQMPHPSGWQDQHGGVALSSPGLCTKCHASSFCQSCHGVALPHSAAFINDHPAQAASWGAVCSKCHGNSDGGATSCYNGECHRSAP